MSLPHGNMHIKPWLAAPSAALLPHRIRPSGGQSHLPQIIQKLRCRRNAGDQQMIARSGACDVEQVALGAIDLLQVGVIPAQRRRGLASALIVETLRRMRADGEGSADIAVHLNNPGAIQTYLGLGFETLGRRAKYERPAER